MDRSKGDASVDKMRVGELARRTNINTQTIRYYERIGLLPEPERSASNYRLYGVEDEKRVRFVKNARSLGLTLGEIKEVLAFHERGELPCAYVTEIIARRSEEIERRIAELTRFKRDLDKLYDRARERPMRQLRPGKYCHIIEKREIEHA